jgi:serine/threonine protein kinase
VLAKAFKEIFECMLLFAPLRHSRSHCDAGYRWLYEKTETIHRDISIGNLMFHEIEGAVYGVLNDFDLALLLSDEKPSTSKQRTGTKPYMAINLLVPEPPYHLYRHDLESFLYVLVFLTCQIEGSPLADWKNLAMEDLKARKTAAITNEGFPSTGIISSNFVYGYWGFSFKLTVTHHAPGKMGHASQPLSI